ncbi:fluoride efflux transporter CrcB [Actinoplanes friuliensis]|jgi:fluoride exporter|uniref:Fluoride-specific ion channel FluC n=1 Tax=Actinoplanes friuliensis DSM 7358 TaxID=1246995 RepID=U5VT74_9ACTN|nr:fluoride efflux transporter CrcB [Actinoplanes friuliensis]AGZ38856.1 putative CrcB-like protein [Actinoplanes friuliensis DSM 7358]
MTLLLVALGAAVGAPLRYLTDRAVQARHSSGFPWGTFTVNIAGSLLLGFLLGLPVAPWLAALLGTGFCGALTTYSTFSLEILRLARGGERFLAAAYAIGSVLAGLGAAMVGVLIAQAV